MAKSLRERFSEKVRVNRENGCHEWTAYLNNDGYGCFGVNGKSEKAHRVAYVLEHGDIPAGMQVLHRCDNPRCVNPEHLFLGTQLDNIGDMHAKKRNTPLPAYKGEQCPWSVLDESKVRAIRARRTGGETLNSLAAAFGVSFSMISQISRRKTWTHI